MAQHDDDEQALVNYLLDAAPLYHRLCSGDGTVAKDDVQDCLGFALPDEEDRPSTGRLELTPFGCPCSKKARVCVDTELAALRCLRCGRMAHQGFIHSFHDVSGHHPKPPYVYQPKSHLTKHLQRLEGQDYPRFSSRMLTLVRDDLIARGISLSTTHPNDVYDSLKRLQLGRLYPHRWAITQRVNPSYQPLCLSHELCERLEHVFLFCYAQYASQRAKTKHKRKFVPYLLFIQHVLPYLGVHPLPMHFKPLKNQTLARRYIDQIHHLLRGAPL